MPTDKYGRRILVEGYQGRQSSTPKTQGFVANGYNGQKKPIPSASNTKPALPKTTSVVHTPKTIKG
jgi:hypothetical protein